MNLSLIIKAVDQASLTIRRITGATRDLDRKGLTPVAAGATRANTAIGQLGSGGVIGRIRAMTGQLKLGERAAYGLGRGIGLAARKLGQMALGAAKWAALGVGTGIGFFAGDIIGTASKFEQFQVILENTEGSAEKARASMAWVTKFAKTTPYEVGDVMQAFVRLRAYGIDPTTGSLTSLGNAASGMGKDLMSAVEMISDAQTGEFERLKEFGIKARKSGNEVTFAWTKNGKDMSKTTSLASSEIRAAITGIFDQNFGGMMDRQSRTFAGMWSNLKDSFTSFELQIANAGVFDMLKGKLSQLSAWIDAQEKNGNLAKWATQISDNLQGIWQWLESIDWKGVGSDIAIIASAVMSLARAFATVAGAINKIPRLPDWMGGGSLNPMNPAGVVLGMGGAAYNRFTATSPQAAPYQGPFRSGMKPGAPMVWPQSAKPGARGGSQVGGKLDINIRSDAGTRAWVSGLSTANPNVPLRVKASRGPVRAAQ